MLDPDQSYSLDEAAVELKIMPTVLLALARKRKIGSLKIGNTWTFRGEHITEFKKVNETKALPANPHGLTDRSLARVRKGRAS